MSAEITRLQDILTQLVDMQRESDLLCTEAISLHNKKVGQHVQLDHGHEGIIVHIECRLALDRSHYQILLTEHIAPKLSTGLPGKSRIRRNHVIAEEWLAARRTRSDAPERRMVVRCTSTLSEPQS